MVYVLHCRTHDPDPALLAAVGDCGAGGLVAVLHHHAALHTLGVPAPRQGFNRDTDEQKYEARNETAIR